MGLYLLTGEGEMTGLRTIVGVLLVFAISSFGHAWVISTDISPPQLSKKDRKKLPMEKTYVLNADSGAKLHFVVSYGADGKPTKKDFTDPKAIEEGKKNPAKVIKKEFVFTTKTDKGSKTGKGQKTHKDQKKYTIILYYQVGKTPSAETKCDPELKKGESATYELDAGDDGIVKVTVTVK
jgi:hypothetical protein